MTASAAAKPQTNLALTLEPPQDSATRSLLDSDDRNPHSTSETTGPRGTTATAHPLREAKSSPGGINQADPHPSTSPTRLTAPRPNRLSNPRTTRCSAASTIHAIALALTRIRASQPFRRHSDARGSRQVARARRLANSSRCATQLGVIDRPESRSGARDESGRSRWARSIASAAHSRAMLLLNSSSAAESGASRSDPAAFDGASCSLPNAA